MPAPATRAGYSIPIPLPRFPGYIVNFTSPLDDRPDHVLKFMIRVAHCTKLLGYI